MFKKLRKLPLSTWSDRELDNLQKYKYTSPASTKLDDLLNTYWWTPLAEVTPPNIHPNMLTLIAMIFSIGFAYLPQQLLSPNSDQPLPRVVYLLTAFSYFVYQSLDAIDGKQARKTGLSSPIGQLMDHGCDALTTVYSSFLIASTLQIPLTSGVAVAVLLTSLSFQLIYYGWYELRHGVYKTSTGGIGVTEGQYAIIILNLIAALKHGIWSWKVGTVLGGDASYIGAFFNAITLHITFNKLVFYPCLMMMTYLNWKELLYLNQVIHSGTAPPSETPTANAWKKNVRVDCAVQDVILICIHLYVQIALCISSAVARHPFTLVPVICFAGAQIVWRIMLASLLDTDLCLYDKLNWPYYAVSLLIAMNLFVDTWFESLLALLLAVYTIGSSLVFAAYHLHQVKTKLGLPLLLVDPTRPLPMAAAVTTSAVTPTAMTASAATPSASDATAPAVTASDVSAPAVTASDVSAPAVTASDVTASAVTAASVTPPVAGASPPAAAPAAESGVEELISGAKQSSAEADALTHRSPGKADGAASSL